MNMWIIYGLLALLMGYTFFIAKTTPKDTSNNAVDYFLCGRNMGGMALTLTFLATQLGGGVILGCSEAAYEYGWPALYYAAGLSLGLFALSLGLGAKFRTLQVNTIPEIFSQYYHSPVLRKAASCILIISMFFILLALGVATRKLFLALDIHSPWLFMSFWAMIIFYTALGGLNAVIKTDIFQILFVLSAFLITFIAILWDPNINLLSVLQSTPHDPTHTLQSIPWSNWLLMPMFFAIIGQDMGQRCFAGKTPKTVSLATAMAGLLLLISALFPVFLGILAKNYHLPIDNASVLIQLIEQLTHPIIASLFAAAILMAILSTADSLLCAISLDLTCDLFSNIQTHRAQQLGKGLTFMVGLLAMGLSYLAIDIIPIMIFAYSLSLSALLIPIFMVLILKHPKPRPAIGAFIVGLSVFCFGAIFKFTVSSEIIALISALACYGVLLVLDRFLQKIHHDHSN